MVKSTHPSDHATTWWKINASKHKYQVPNQSNINSHELYL